MVGNRDCTNTFALADIEMTNFISGNPCSKLFEKFTQHSGGVELGTCQHGIINSYKPLVGGESARDLVDIEMSR